MFSKQALLCKIKHQPTNKNQKPKTKTKKKTNILYNFKEIFK